MYFDVTVDGLLLPGTDPALPPTGISPNLLERLRSLARQCILSPLEDGLRPTPTPDDSDYAYALEELGVSFTDTPKGEQDAAWPMAEFRLAYEAEFLRCGLRAAAKLGARRCLYGPHAGDEAWHIDLYVEASDLIRLAFEDDLEELEAALEEPDAAPVESPEDDIERARRLGSPMREALFPDDTPLREPRTLEMKRDLFGIAEGVDAAEFARRAAATSPSFGPVTHELPGVYPNIEDALIGLVHAPWKWENPIEGTVRLRCRVRDPKPPHRVVVDGHDENIVFAFDACSAYEPPIEGAPVKLTVAYGVARK